MCDPFFLARFSLVSANHGGIYSSCVLSSPPPAQTEPPTQCLRCVLCGLCLSGAKGSELEWVEVGAEERGLALLLPALHVGPGHVNLGIFLPKLA